MDEIASFSNQGVPKGLFTGVIFPGYQREINKRVGEIVQLESSLAKLNGRTGTYKVEYLNENRTGIVIKVNKPTREKAFLNIKVMFEGQVQDLGFSGNSDYRFLGNHAARWQYRPVIWNKDGSYTEADWNRIASEDPASLIRLREGVQKGELTLKRTIEKMRDDNVKVI